MTIPGAVWGLPAGVGTPQTHWGVFIFKPMLIATPGEVKQGQPSPLEGL